MFLRTCLSMSASHYDPRHCVYRKLNQVDNCIVLLILLPGSGDIFLYFTLMMDQVLR